MEKLFLWTLIGSLSLVLPSRIGDIKIKFTRIEIVEEDPKYFVNLTVVMKHYKNLYCVSLLSITMISFISIFFLIKLSKIESLSKGK